MTYQQYARFLHTTAPSLPLIEWQIVMFFYAAVHATNSVLYAPGGAPLTHTRHEANMFVHAGIDLLMVEYQELKALSLTARYKPQLHPLSAAELAHATRLSTVMLAGCGVP